MCCTMIRLLGQNGRVVAAGDRWDCAGADRVAEPCLVAARPGRSSPAGRVTPAPDASAHYRGAPPGPHLRHALSIWAETSCLCLMEAMSAGLVCIHSNYAALPETAANWNQMYQLHEDVNQHAGIFYNILDNAVTKAKENFQPNSSASSYSNVFYGWERRTHEWNAMLTSLIENTKDRSIQGKMFRYGT